MQFQTVRISAPSRIHFGLLSLGGDSPRQYGGAGVMLQSPRTDIVVSPSKKDSFQGPHAERVAQFVERWRCHAGHDGAVSCVVDAAPPEHIGLGLGTQLGLCVATAMDYLCGRREVAISERALSVRRGLRSAVGTHGFIRGGLIVESGKSQDETLGELKQRIGLPNSWRVLLICPKHRQGLAGNVEADAFARMPEIPPDVTQKLRDELFLQLAPAAKAGNFERFSESVYRYGLMAGHCFATVQEGPFLTPLIADIVDFARGEGVRGVGQSSWGPTVYAWFQSQPEAEKFASALRNDFPNLNATFHVTGVEQHGACIETQIGE